MSGQSLFDLQNGGGVFILVDRLIVSCISCTKCKLTISFHVVIYNRKQLHNGSGGIAIQWSLVKSAMILRTP